MTENKLKKILIKQIEEWFDYLGYKGYDEVDAEDIKIAIEGPNTNKEVRDWVNSMSWKEFDAFCGEISETMCKEFWKEEKTERTVKSLIECEKVPFLLEEYESLKKRLEKLESSITI